MTKGQRVKRELLRRVSNFGAIHADRFPEGSEGQEEFANVNAAIALYEASNKSRSDKQDGARTHKDIARALLLMRMNAIIRTARSIAVKQPGADSRFQPPLQSADTAILASAQAYLDRLEPMKEAFVRRGLRANFIDEFRQAIEQFAESLDGRSVDKTGRIDATAATAAAIAQGMQSVRLLDVVVANTFVDEPQVLATWKRWRRMETPGPAEAAVDDPAPETAPAPQPVGSD